MDPDPFDSRHPCRQFLFMRFRVALDEMGNYYYVMFLGRANPDCALGHVLKILLKNDDFIDKVCRPLLRFHMLMFLPSVFNVIYKFVYFFS